MISLEELIDELGLSFVFLLAYVNKEVEEDLYVLISRSDRSSKDL